MDVFLSLVWGIILPTLDDIKPGARLRGLDPAGTARRGPGRTVRHRRPESRVQGGRAGVSSIAVRRTSFEFIEADRSYALGADGGLFRLASEAHRIRLAHLFDPYLAVSASQIEALPHQITAVYGEMLPRQPLRFLLADDPGAGKTIMADLHQGAADPGVSSNAAS